MDGAQEMVLKQGVKGLLEAIDEGADLGVRPVGVAYDLAADDALAVNDIGLGPALGVVELCGALGGVADGGEVHMAAEDEAAVGVGVFIDADAEDGEIGTVVVELDEGRHLLDAGRAPGGPEVEQDNLAPVAGEMDGGGSIEDGEVGGRLVHLRRARAAITGGGEGQRQQDEE